MLIFAIFLLHKSIYYRQYFTLIIVLLQNTFLMKYLFKKAIFALGCVLFCVLAPINKLLAISNTYFFEKPTTPITIPFTPTDYENVVFKLYDSLQLNFYGCSVQAFEYAMQGYNMLYSTGQLAKQIISIIDFTKPSFEKRLFVLDVQQMKILFTTYVAHGQGSGQAMATAFSNVPESYKSSLGFYKTASTYFGKNGFSLKLLGLEKGVNDKAAERSIVMHGAPYVSQTIIDAQGFLGRSQGCPAVPQKLSKPIIDKIKEGSCLFIYSNNNKYLSHSAMLH